MAASVRIHNVRSGDGDEAVVVTDGHGHIVHIPAGKSAVVNLDPGEAITLKQDATPETDGQQKGRVRARKPEPEPEVTPDPETDTKEEE